MGLISLFQRDDSKDPITSLKLDAPPQRAKPVAQAATAGTDPSLIKAAAEEVTRRARQMLAEGKQPEMLYLIVDETGKGVMTTAGAADHRIVLIFTSVFAARDYVEVTKWQGGILQLPLSSLPGTVNMWRSLGIAFCALDRCPRCPQVQMFSIANGMTVEQFRPVWASIVSSRIFNCQRIVGAYMAKSDERAQPSDGTAGRLEKRRLLEHLRDHLDPSVPYVHWLIALDAGMDGDEEVRRESIRRLDAFGPRFKDKVPANGMAKEWMTSVTEALIGLSGSYLMLRPDLQTAMQTVDIPFSQPSSES